MTKDESGRAPYQSPRDTIPYDKPMGQARQSPKQFLRDISPYDKLTGQAGQGVLETAIVTMLFMCAVVFAVIQLCIITYGYLAGHDAAFAAVRSAVVQKSIGDAKSAARNSGFFVMASQISGTNNITPEKVTVWDKNPLGKAPKDYAGQQVVMYSAHMHYGQSIMFPSLLQPFNPTKFYGGGNPLLKMITHARMMRSPDREYLTKAYPGAEEW